MIRPFLVAAMCASLAACASTPTVFQAAAGPTAVGYSDYRIEPGRYRVTFRGGPGAPAQQVMDLALLRAADIALAEGYDWFRVASRVTDALPDRSPSVGLGVGTGSYGRRGGVSVGLGNSFSLGGGPALSATLEVVMGRGEKPDMADSYDAKAIRASLGQRT